MVATFSQTSALSSRKYVSEQGMSIFFGLQSFVFAWEKLPKNLTFQSFLAPTSRKYVAEQGIVIPNWSKTLQTFRPHSSVLALEKQS